MVSAKVTNISGNGYRVLEQLPMLRVKYHPIERGYMRPDCVTLFDLRQYSLQISAHFVSQ